MFFKWGIWVPIIPVESMRRAREKSAGKNCSWSPADLCEWERVYYGKPSHLPLKCFHPDSLIRAGGPGEFLCSSLFYSLSPCLWGRGGKWQHWCSGTCPCWRLRGGKYQKRIMKAFAFSLFMPCLWVFVKKAYGIHAQLCLRVLSPGSARKAPWAWWRVCSGSADLRFKCAECTAMIVTATETDSACSQFPGSSQQQSSSTRHILTSECLLTAAGV